MPIVDSVKQTLKRVTTAAVDWSQAAPGPAAYPAGEILDPIKLVILAERKG